MLRRLIHRLYIDRSGQDLAEYGIALAVIAAATVLAVPYIGGVVATMWQRASSALGDVVNAL